MSGLRRQADGTFEVDLRAFAQQSWMERLRGAPFPIDPFLVGRVLVAGMSESLVRDAEGRKILANFHRLVMHPEDFEELMRLRVTLNRQIGGLLRRHAEGSKGVLIDAPAATFVPDESGTLARGRAVLRPEIRETGQLPGDRAGEVTLRFDDAQAAPQEPPPVAAQAAVTPPAAALVWSGGRAELVEGTRYAFGRPHDGAPPRFIALVGAPAEVSRVQAWVEVRAGEVRIGRTGANPVRVQGRPVQPGGETTVQGDPVELLLGERFVVKIERRA